MVTSHMYEIK